MLCAMSGFAPQPTRAGLHRSLCHALGRLLSSRASNSVVSCAFQELFSALWAERCVWLFFLHDCPAIKQLFQNLLPVNHLVETLVQLLRGLLWLQAFQTNLACQTKIDNAQLAPGLQPEKWGPSVYRAQQGVHPYRKYRETLIRTDRDLSGGGWNMLKHIETTNPKIRIRSSWLLHHAEPIFVPPEQFLASGSWAGDGVWGVGRDFGCSK